VGVTPGLTLRQYLFVHSRFSNIRPTCL